MLSLSGNRSSQQDSEQGATANASGQHMLTSTLDFGSCYVRLICGDAGAETGSCCLSPNNESREKGTNARENWSPHAIIKMSTLCLFTINVCGHAENSKKGKKSHKRLNNQLFLVLLPEPMS